MIEPDPALRRAAHRVVLGAFAGATVPDWLPALVAEGLGGICLYGNNIAASAAAEVSDSTGIRALAGEIGALSPALVLALDEEGGDVTRLHYADGSPYPGNAVLGRYDDLATTTAVARAIGTELKGAGIWLNLAPDADINSNPYNPVIGTRSFGDSPDLVARHTVAWVRGLQEKGVAACVKHFPGHGDTATDSHLALPHVDADLATLRARELLPFVAAIEAGAASVMTSHLVLEALDPVRPATLSPAILTGLLRDELGYEGVVVTDALDMAGASATLGVSPDDGVAAAAVASLVAGADLLCLGPSLRGRGAAEITDVVDAILAAVADGTLLAARLLEAAGRVEALATSYGTGRVPADHDLVDAGRAAGRVAARAVLDAVAPLCPGAPLVVRLETGSTLAVGDAGWGDLGLPAVRRTPHEGPTTVEVAAYDGPVVVVARQASADPASWAWLRDLLVRRPDTLVVELGWPSPQVEALPHVLRGWGSALAPSRAVGDAITAAQRTGAESAGEHR